MKKARSVSIFFILISILLGSCRTEADLNKTPDYLVFGHFYGFSLGEESIEIFKLESKRLFEDLQDNYPTYQEPYNAEFELLGDEKFNQVKGLIDTIPEELFSESSKIIGAPDTADEGGLYIEVMIDGRRLFWLVDMAKENVPEYLHEFMDEIIYAIRLLQ